MQWIFFFFIIYSYSIFANPFWNPAQVTQDAHPIKITALDISHLKTVSREQGLPVLRIQVDWNEEDERYSLAQQILEYSGTPALLSRSTHKPRWGSYLGVISNQQGKELFYDSIGTGKEYRKLTRAISLRFPAPQEDVTFELFAEHPQTGVMQSVIKKTIRLSELKTTTQQYPDLEVKELLLATKNPSLRINIYAEGYNSLEKNKFWKHSLKTVKTLQKQHFPGIEYFSFYGVFNPSQQKLREPEH